MIPDAYQRRRRRKQAQSVPHHESRGRGHLGNFQIVKRCAEQKLDIVIHRFRTVHNQLIRDHRSLAVQKKGLLR